MPSTGRQDALCIAPVSPLNFWSCLRIPDMTPEASEISLEEFLWHIERGDPGALGFATVLKASVNVPAYAVHFQYLQLDVRLIIAKFKSISAVVPRSHVDGMQLSKKAGEVRSGTASVIY